MNELGKIPEVGDVLECLGLKIEVISMEGKRVDNVRITDLREDENEYDNAEDENNESREGKD